MTALLKTLLSTHHCFALLFALSIRQLPSAPYSFFYPYRHTHTLLSMYFPFPSCHIHSHRLPPPHRKASCPIWHSRPWRLLFHCTCLLDGGWTTWRWSSQMVPMAMVIIVIMMILWSTTPFTAYPISNSSLPTTILLISVLLSLQ